MRVASSNGVTRVVEVGGERDTIGCAKTRRSQTSVGAPDRDCARGAFARCLASSALIRPQGGNFGAPRYSGFPERTIA
jgi:hypothetical protein